MDRTSSRHYYIMNRLQTQKSITIRSWNKYSMPKMVMTIKQMKAVQHFQLRDNLQRYILIQIGHVKFINIQILSLQNNRIESIQILASMHLPNAKELDLSFNKINSIDELRKMNTPQLQIIRFSDNKILENKHIGELRANHLEELTIEKYYLSYQIEDIRYIAKLESPRLCYFTINPRVPHVILKCRILHTNIVEVIGRKYIYAFNFLGN